MRFLSFIIKAALEAKKAAEAAEKQRLEDLRIAAENQVCLYHFFCQSFELLSLYCVL